jgi:hypothetical protein
VRRLSAAKILANLSLFILSLLLKPRDLHCELFPKLFLGRGVSRRLRDFALKKNFLLGDLRLYLLIDFPKATFLIVSQLFGRRIFLEPAHSEFERRFHGSNIAIGASRTQKICRRWEDV